MFLSTLPDLRGHKIVSLDTETKDDGLAQGLGPGWALGMSRIVGISLATQTESWYLPVEFYPRMGEWLSSLFSQSETLFVFHNANYDCGGILKQFGVRPPARLADTAAMAAIADENRPSYSLDNLCIWRGLPGKDETLLRQRAKELGIKDIKANLWRLPHEDVAPYAKQDAAATLALYHSLLAILEAEETLGAYQLEADLIPLILEMRLRGIRVDTDAAERAVVHFADERDKVLAELAGKLAVPVDMEAIRSPGWMLKTFQREGVPFGVTPKGNPSFDSKELAKLNHWLPNLITRAKKLNDASTKFFGNYILKFAKNGRIHANINQFNSEEGGTKSHRFSYSTPPLQQSPSREGEFASIFRGAFLPEIGEVWGSLDYSQQEYRMIVHYAEVTGCRGAAEAGDMYRNDPTTDFHDMVVGLTGLDRKRAKDCNFAKAYEAGIAQFAMMTGMSLTEAKATMDKYDARVPFVKELSKLCTRRAEKTGQIRLLDGALCHFPYWETTVFGTPGMPTDRETALARVRDPEHPWYDLPLKRAWAYKALNRLSQGGSARQVKLAMRDCWREGLVPLIQLHDELGFSFSSEAQAERAKDIMINAVQLVVPMKVDSEFGFSWGNSMLKNSWEKAYVDVRNMRGV